MAIGTLQPCPTRLGEGGLQFEIWISRGTDQRSTWGDISVLIGPRLHMVAELLLSPMVVHFQMIWCKREFFDAGRRMIALS